MSLPAIGIVTGAAGGIGKAVALSLAARGVDLVVTDLSESALAALSREGAALAGRMLAVAGDIVDPTLGAQLVEATTKTFGKPSLLVNCAGYLQDARIQKMNPQQFDRLIAINLIGPLRVADTVLRSMSGVAWGRIILLSSRAWLGNFGSSGYSAAKGGIVGATRNLALAYASTGITVNCIAPGFIDTPMARSLPPTILQRVVAAIPVGRTGTVEDVSALVHYLADSGSGYVTGQTLVACGGRSLTGPISKSL